MSEEEIVRQLDDVHRERALEVDRLQRIDQQMRKVKELILLAEHEYIEVTAKRYGEFRMRRRGLIKQRAEVVTRLSHMKQVRRDLEWELYKIRKFGDTQQVAA